MTFDVAKKVPLLQCFYEKLYEEGWSIEGVGDSADYRVLLKYFAKVIRVFESLDKEYQTVIADITRRMGCGMADYATKTTSIDTVESYNLYCHYVAGLVGHGLSALFVASGLEAPRLQTEERLSNSMGLFLQKTNIIRDYLEDLQEGRTWWPQEIWSQYADTLGAFAEAPRAARSLACLNHMVTDALALVPDSLAYLSLIRDRKIFEFCAIPQVMAMSTLELCYNNTNILSRTSVKIRKGLSCKLMLHASTLTQVHGWFHAFANRIEERIPASDPSAQRTRELVQQTKAITEKEAARMPLGPKRLTPRRLRVATVAAWGALIAASVYAATRSNLPAEGISKTSIAARVGGPLTSPLLTRVVVDTAVATGAAISAGFLGGIFGMQFV